MDVSGKTKSMASYALTMWSALFGADPSSLCVTGATFLLRTFTVVCAIITVTSVAWPMRSPHECARRNRSCVCSHLL